MLEANEKKSSTGTGSSARQGKQQAGEGSVGHQVSASSEKIFSGHVKEKAKKPQQAALKFTRNKKKKTKPKALISWVNQMFLEDEVTPVVPKNTVLWRPPPVHHPADSWGPLTGCYLWSQATHSTWSKSFKLIPQGPPEVCAWTAEEASPALAIKAATAIEGAICLYTQTKSQLAQWQQATEAHPQNHKVITDLLSVLVSQSPHIQQNNHDQCTSFFQWGSRTFTCTRKTQIFVTHAFRSNTDAVAQRASANPLC